MTHKDLIGTLPMEHERWSGGIQKTFNFNCVQGEDGSLVSVTSPLLPSNSICRGHSGGRRDLEGESHRPDVMQDRSWDQSAYVMTWIRWSLVAEPRWWSAWLQVGVCPECAYSPWPQGAGKESNRARRTWGDQEADNQRPLPFHPLRTTDASAPTTKPRPRKRKSQLNNQTESPVKQLLEETDNNLRSNKKLIRMPRKHECSLKETFWR